MERNVSLKNYLWYAVLVIVTMLFAFYLGKWYQKSEKSYESNKNMEDIFLVVRWNELSNYLLETPDTIIYVSGEDEKSLQMDSQMKQIIVDKNLREEVIYLELTPSQEKKFKKKYLDGKTLEMPNIYEFDDGKITGSIRNEYPNLSEETILMYLKQVGALSE